MKANLLVRSVQLLVTLALLVVVACRERVTGPGLAAARAPSALLICDDESVDGCTSNPDPTPPQPDLWYQPPDVAIGAAPDYVTDLTAQSTAASAWNAIVADTVFVYAYPPGGADCDVMGYTRNGQTSENCPSGPCYEQWRGMRDAGWRWTTLVNSLLVGGLAIRRGAWGLFALSLPASTSAAATWSSFDMAHKKYTMCMSQDNNWWFYHPYTTNPYQYPRYPNGMPR